jgi:hypothetical protein
VISAVVASRPSQSKLAIVSMHNAPAPTPVSQTERPLDGPAAASVQVWPSGDVAGRR